MEIRTETVRKKIFLLREIAPKYECFDYIFNCCIITMLHSRVSFNLLLSTSLPCQQRGWSTPSGVLLLQYFDIALWLFWDVTLDFVHYSRIYNIKLFKYVMTKCDASGYTSQQLSETWLAIMNSLIRRGRRWEWWWSKCGLTTTLQNIRCIGVLPRLQGPLGASTSWHLMSPLEACPAMSSIHVPP